MMPNKNGNLFHYDNHPFDQSQKNSFWVVKKSHDVLKGWYEPTISIHNDPNYVDGWIGKDLFYFKKGQVAIYLGLRRAGAHSRFYYKVLYTDTEGNARIGWVKSSDALFLEKIYG